MKNMLKELCMQLAKAETKQEAIKAVGNYWDSPDYWHPVGDNPGNGSIALNQAASADRSLAEKFTNIDDEIFILECLKRGIDPKGPEAPKSPKEALEMFFKVRNGDLSNISGREKTKLANRSKLIATGTKEHTNYIIQDKATGQSAKSAIHTFLALNSGNKNEIPFTKGQHTMGSTAVFGYTDLQFIVSKQHKETMDENDETADNYCFALVRLRDPQGNEDNAVLEYLSPDKNKLFNFSASSLNIMTGEYPNLYNENLEHGSFIKLYDYKMTPKTIKEGIITTKLNFRMSLLIPEISIPVRFCERRNMKIKDHRDHNMTGLKTRLVEDKANNLEFDPMYGSMIIDDEKINYSIFVFKKGSSSSYKKNESLIMTVKGQNMGSLDGNFFDRAILKDLKILKSSLLVIVDFSEVANKHKIRIFTSSRDRIRKDYFLYEKFEKDITQRIAKNSVLRDLASRRFNETLKDRVKDNRLLEQKVQDAIRSNPNLSHLLGNGKSPIKSPLRDDEKGQIELFVGNQFPTFFELVRKFNREKPKPVKVEDSSFIVKFKTDAVNDYFQRDADPGKFSIFLNGAPIHDYDFNLVEGKMTLHVNNPGKVISAHEIIRLQWIVNDISRVEPFQGELFIKGKEGKTKRWTGKKDPKQPEALKLPNMIPITKEEWDNENKFDENSAVCVLGGGKNMTIYFNLDNKYLLHEIRKKPEMKLAVQEIWNISLALMTLTKLHANEAYPTNDINKRIFEDTRDYSPMILSQSKLSAELQYSNAA